MTPARLKLRTGQPIWLGPPAVRGTPPHPQLAGRHHADVVIVGGGFTGVLAALRFAEAGVEPLVLEAGRVGYGSTAASSALLLQEPDARLSALTERYGERTARRIWRVSHDAARDLIRLLRRLPRAGPVAARDTVYYATEASEVAALHAEYVARRRAGFEAAWLTPGALRTEAGIPARAGILTRGNACTDPVRACEAIARAAMRAGARMFERSAARRIDTRRDGVRIRTDGGVVEAHQVVIATGYATRHFRPLAGRFRMAHTYVVATAPLDVRARRELGLADVMLWDSRRRYHYGRWTPDRRLLLGGADRPIRGGQSAAARLATAIADIRGHFERLLPALGDLAITHAWEGRFANTADSLPYVGLHRRYPGHAFALGYGGNGMTFAALAGRMLVEQWQGISSKDHTLFAFDR
jgi:glycine/D-amino acid oxidase-like deaminating enzyme